MERDKLRLYLVTDSLLAGDRDVVDIVMEAVKGGVTMVQLREKNLDTRSFIRRASLLNSLLLPHGVPLVINDRVDVALATDAAGVHVGQSDMPCEMVRRLLGPGKIIGLSVESHKDVSEANSLDIDYIAVSPVFATDTKTDTASPFGLDGLSLAVRSSVHPVVGIGGMNVSTASDVMRTGAAGIAVVSAIMSAESPAAAASQMLEKLGNF
ncbi:MAG: thiamine phosphate synthase [Bacteroidales bacterium]|nr:thiamine phosphate synthase [Bacteroidales bacterium]